MANKNMMLKDVRLSFPVLFEAKAYEQGGKKEFNASFLIPKDSPVVEEIRTAFKELATEQWGDDASKILKGLFAQDKLCLHDGDNKDYDGYEGHFYLRANNKTRPLCLNKDRSPVTESDGILYSGCYVNASIGLWTQDNQFGKRINANLRGVQFSRDGEAFAGGGVASEDEFPAESGGATETVGEDSDVGF